ncbi:MAG: hypothetical protein ABJK37_12245 [Paraglaciecola sp.]|uniref:hypothetical protein n=1 Tax=Paraglaciecola sp. TaxID=1920173 RepID=UPI0032976364
MKTQLKLVETAEVPNNTIGSIHSFSEQGQISIISEFHVLPTAAISTQYFADPNALIGEKVLISFIDNDVNQPVIVGLVAQSVKNEVLIQNQSKQQKKLSLSVETFQLTASEEIVLNVGRSQVVLDRFGKVVIKGKDITSRASSKNKMKGGNISLN